MARINVKKPVYEDFKISPGKARRAVSKEPDRKWSFFGKAGLTGWFLKKASKKASYAPKTWNQKSIAKVSYMKNSYKGQWGVHGRYLARQGAQLENAPGLGFDAENNDLNISKTLRGWQEQDDPRLWKIILSPEMAHKLNLKAHVRAVMASVEKDLGSKLEWVAIDHYNTDNFHAHIVMRGVDKEGRELRLDQKYFTQGFRQRSIEEATRTLGLRLEADELAQRNKVVRAMHITEIDREIKRKLTQDNFINLDFPKSGHMYAKELQLRGRLMFLEEMGVAKSFSSASWHIDPGFLDYLKFIQNQQDIIKTKNRHIENIINPSLPIFFNKLENAGDILIGSLVGMGLSERPGEPRYMLIEGIDNKIHYVLAPEGITKKRDGGDLRNGDMIYLERREFINKEQKKIKYIFGENFKDFQDFLSNDKLSNLDLYIVNNLRQIPKTTQFDASVRKTFFNLVKGRIEVLKKEHILFDDLSVNEGKLQWTLENDVRITGPRLRLSLGGGY